MWNARVPGAENTLLEYKKGGLVRAMTDRAFHFGAPDVPGAEYQPSYAELRLVFEEIRNIPGHEQGDVRVSRTVLKNGMTVAQFCTWYLLHHMAR